MCSASPTELFRPLCTHKSRVRIAKIAYALWLKAFQEIKLGLTYFSYYERDIVFWNIVRSCMCQWNCNSRARLWSETLLQKLCVHLFLSFSYLNFAPGPRFPLWIQRFVRCQLQHSILYSRSISGRKRIWWCACILDTSAILVDFLHGLNGLRSLGGRTSFCIRLLYWLFCPRD